MYNYKGKILNIPQELIDDFKKYKGIELEDEDIETYLYYYCRKKS